MTAATHQSIAVIIPALNEAAGLPELLNSLFAQTLAPREIIVVDAGSSDNTREIVDQIAKSRTGVRCVYAPGALPGAARNAGIAQTECEIIAHIDGGCRVQPDWLEHLIGPLLAGNADYVTGNVELMESPSRWYKWAFDAAAIICATMTWFNRSTTSMAGGAAIAYRRWIWEAAGGQPVFMRIGEDVVFTRRVALLNVRQAFSPHSVCSWQAGPTIRRALKKKYLYVKSDCRHDRMSGQIRPVIIRTAVVLGCVPTIALWQPFAAVPAAMALLLLAQRFFKACLRYRKNQGTFPGVRTMLLLGATCAGVLGAEHAGLVAGCIDRLRRGSLQKQITTYLAGPHSTI